MLEKRCPQGCQILHRHILDLCVCFLLLPRLFARPDGRGLAGAEIPRIAEGGTRFLGWQKSKTHLQALQPLRLSLDVSMAQDVPLTPETKVLIRLKNSLEQHNNQTIVSNALQDWNPSDSSPCQWKRINCSNRQNKSRVISLDLSDLGLTVFPASILSNLTALSILNLSQNNLTVLPTPSLSNLTVLSNLNMSYNNLEISLLLEICQCKTLTILDLSMNKMSGSIPQCFEGLSNLRVLNLAANSFNSYDFRFSNLTDLSNLNLSDNNLGNSLLQQICQCKTLTTLDVSMNKMSGNIPQCFEGLSNLQVLNLAANSFNRSGFSFSNLTDLSYLNLSDNNLGKSLLQEICQCKTLTTLDLSTNKMTGNVPECFGDLSSLQVLNLAANNFTGSVKAALPESCENLRIVNLSSNSFDTIASYKWENCTNLQLLDLGDNQLVGSVAANIGELHSLHYLFLSGNKLTVFDPKKLCSTGMSLKILDLASNILTGTIPPEVGNCTSLEELNLSQNFFSGGIPSELGRLGRLRTLVLGSNNLAGSIPSGINSCKNLTFLDLSSNLLEGSVPTFLGQMQSLVCLVLHSNRFSGLVPTEIMDLPELLLLDMSNNSLSGNISQQLSHMSLLSIHYLLLANNHFFGEIPSELGNVSGLQFLDLSSNEITGSIPSSFGKLQRLLWLNLANNWLTGQIPQELGNCTSLLWLNLRSNKLTGNLPKELVSMGCDPSATFDLNLKRRIYTPKAIGVCLMFQRWVPENYHPYSFIYEILDRKRCRQLLGDLLTGQAMGPACGAVTRRYVQVTDNNLTGPLPDLFQNQTGVLLLSLNHFNGSLPPSLSKLPLLGLNVSHNQLSGSIPAALGDSQCLSLLDLSFNNLSGEIPVSLTKLTQLTRFNISYNPFLSGSVPQGGQFLTFSQESYLNDSHLCIDALPSTSKNASIPTMGFCNALSSSGTTQYTPTVPTNSMRFKRPLFIGIACSFGVLLCGLVGFCIVWNWPVRTSDVDFALDCKEVGEIFPVNPSNTIVCLFKSANSSLPIKQLTYADILLATNNFDESNVIGCGGFGIVYKANLADGSQVAIKKLVQDGPQGEREFLAEMQTLDNHVHENLVPLFGCCAFGRERLLIYKFLSNGSLEHWLYEKHGGAEVLHWSRRLGIACGAAKGLRYLHHDCRPMIIHRDMKASNILLDDNFKAYLTDFGLARELDPTETHVSTVVAGTLGYVPPEYSQTWRATTKGDVFSFGMVLLELITGRRPFSVTESSNEGSLLEWVRLLLKEGRVEEVYDPIVKRSIGKDELTGGELWEFLKLGVSCTKEASERRPTMTEVVRVLEALQEKRGSCGVYYIYPSSAEEARFEAI